MNTRRYGAPLPLFGGKDGLRPVVGGGTSTEAPGKLRRETASENEETWLFENLGSAR